MQKLSIITDSQYAKVPKDEHRFFNSRLQNRQFLLFDFPLFQYIPFHTGQ